MTRYQSCSVILIGWKTWPPINVGKTLKIFLSESTRPNALIFGMVHDHLVDFYQACSNYGTGAKSGPVLGITKQQVAG